MTPSPVHPALAQAAVDDFLASPKWQQTCSKYGWILTRLEPLILIATLPAPTAGGVVENFTVRVTCAFYPTYPPDVHFVSPETYSFTPQSDARHVPVLQAPYCYTHLAYPFKQPYCYGPQLICSSMTLGYYVSGHNPTVDQRWDPGRHTIGSSLYTIHKALHSSHYRGRHAG